MIRVNEKPLKYFIYPNNNITEIFKIIKDYPNYTISNLGRIKNTKRNKFHSLVINAKGYLFVGLSNKEGLKSFSVHRLVASHFVVNTNPEKFNIVNHLDGIKLHNWFTNLEWIDTVGNIKHAQENNLYSQGEKHHNSKLTKKQVKFIFEKVHQSYPISSLMKLFNVRRKTINEIRDNKTWKSLNLNKKDIKSIDSELHI